MIDPDPVGEDDEKTVIARVHAARALALPRPEAPVYRHSGPCRHRSLERRLEGAADCVGKLLPYVARDERRRLAPEDPSGAAVDVDEPAVAVERDERLHGDFVQRRGEEVPRAVGMGQGWILGGGVVG